MLEHPYTALLRRVDRPGRYLGGEFGAAVPSDEDRVLAALAFPDVYEIGMSHMGLSILYEVVAKMDGIRAERVFMPWTDMEKELRKAGLPLLSLESATPLSEFDLVGFSLQYELTYTNLVAMLDLGEIPLRARDRKDGDPIVVGGGPLAVQAEPVSPFLDLIVVGDGEGTLPRMLRVLDDAKKAGKTRAECVEAMAEDPAVFAPGKCAREQDERSRRLVVVGGDSPVASRSHLKTIEDLPPGDGPVPMISAVFDRYSVEIARGCTQGCRFCQAGFIYRPVRERSPEAAREAVNRAVSCLGFDEVSLAALSSADHSAIGPLVSNLGDEFTSKRVSFSVPSLRAYGLPEELVEVVSRMRATGVTLAPEAGSQRLRDLVNKNVDEDDLMNAAARFFDKGIRRVKLYFMLGLPTETDEDLLAILDLSSRLESLARRRLRGRKPQLVVSVSTFVPKPFTPFERERMIGIDEIRRRQNLLAEEGRRRKLTVRLHDPRLSWLEGIFARGDARLADSVERATKAGARFDGWGEKYRQDIWEDALQGVQTDVLLEEIDEQGRLPWDHVDVGVSEKFRREERARAMESKSTAPCGRFERAKGEAPAFVCHACGVKCKPSDLPVMRRRSPAESSEEPRVAHHSKPAPSAPQQLTEGVRFRFELAVWGRQIFLGHLDTMRHFTRGLRRAGLEVEYSRGFHPKPRIESAPPLPLGTAGLAEPLDLRLLDPPSDEEILQRMGRSLPADMEVTGLSRMEQGKKLAKSLVGARYVVFAAVGETEVAKAARGMLEAKEITVERERKGKTRVFDARPFLLSARVLDSKPAEFRLPDDPDKRAMELVVEVPPSGGARPVDLLSGFLDLPQEDLWIVRTGWIYEGDPAFEGRMRT